MERIEKKVVARLRETGKTAATAESCTGGLIAKRITDCPGASAVFCGGVVSYTNAVKASVLSVSQTLLDEYGAVSEPVARAMAEGARALLAADFAVSVTGVAGPDVDDRGNAVGTVWIALAQEGKTVSLLRQYGALSRAEIRTRTAEDALALLLDALN